MTFLNAPLLWGLLLASIPIIIHFLFRRRFRRIDWAPMHYLKLTIQKNRRRIELEQLALLLMRIALVALLFFLVARPVQHAEGMGAWLGGRSRTSQMLLIDDSLSMGYREGRKSAFEQAQEQAAEVLKAVGPKDKFTLVLASRPEKPLLNEQEVPDQAVANDLIAALRPSESHVSWQTTLKEMDGLLERATYPIRELTIITDLRRAGWEQDLAELGNRWNNMQLRVRIFDVGSQRDNNVILDEFRQIDPLCMVGSPVQFEAVVRNGSDYEAAGLEANLIVDGKPSLMRLPNIPPRETVQVPVLATFQDPGTHHISLSLPADSMPGDNQRWVVCQVRESLSVTLIDGEPSSEPMGGELDFLALVLQVDETESFRLQLVPDSEWDPSLQSAPDLIVLGNVASLTPEQAKKLERMVDAGTGLIIFVGDQVDPSSYDQLLYKDGTGLLPAALDSVVEEEISGILNEPGAPGPLDTMFQFVNPAGLERIKVHKFYQVQIPQEKSTNVRVLARWNSAESAPAVIQKVYGQGKVLLCTTTADKSWNDWPTEPSYLLAFREASKAVARADNKSRGLTARETLRHPLAPNVKASAPTVETPDGQKPQAMQIEEVSQNDKSDDGTSSGGGSPTRTSGDRPQTLTYAETYRAGLYKLNWQAIPGGQGSDLYAVNPDRRESELKRISKEEITAKWGRFKDVHIVSRNGGSDEALDVRGQEIWRVLASAMFGLLIIESCFATFVGRQR